VEDGGWSLFRSMARRMKQLAGNVLGTERFCKLVEQRLKDAGLPELLSSHSLRVSAITDLFMEGVRWSTHARVWCCLVNRPDIIPKFSDGR
jgi:hypothetical protein